MAASSGPGSTPAGSKSAPDREQQSEGSSAPASESPTSLRPGDEVADVEVVELLGASVTTETWRGKRADGTEVVVHSLRPSASAKARDHFLAGAGSLAATLRQRPLTGLMAASEVDPLAGAYVGEVNPVGTLADVPKMGWPLEQRVELMRQLCAGLQALHTIGRVHGCLEPEIIVIDEAERPVLSNAGLVDIAAHCREAPAEAEMYRTYSAPEVRAGKPATARADVFSAGRLLHYLLLGEPPDEVDEPIARLDSLAGSPAGLVRIVRKCTALDPKARYPEAGSLLADLHRYARGQETGSRHPEVDDERAAPGAPTAAARSTPPVSPARPERSGPRPGYTKKPAARARDASPAKGPTRKARSAALAWSPRQAAVFALLGLAGLGATVGVGYATGESPLVMQLVGLLAGACLGFALPGRGPSPRLVRVLSVTIGLALVGHVDPTSLAAARKKSRSGLQGATVADRVAALKAERQAGNKQFPRVDLSDGQLDGMLLSDVVLDGGSLRKASCKGTDFRNASLLNVDVTGANFSGAKLEGILPGFMIGWRETQCDATTLMPAGWICPDGKPTAAKSGGPR